jgi:2-oxoglutarate ferredoxin oxidoreductase subunit gamma
MGSRHYEIRFGGSGGQGMMLMGDVMAQAAGVIEGNEILLAKSYGPESRGGACRSELIVDNDSINYPIVRKPNFVLAMTQMACDKYHLDMDKDGVLLVDSDLVKEVPQDIEHVYRIPLTKLAMEVTGKPIAANVVALGAISVLGRCAGSDAVLQAILNQFAPKLHDMNRKAFQAGIVSAQSLLA